MIPGAGLSPNWILVVPVTTIVVTILVLLWLSRQNSKVRALIEHLSAKTELVIEHNKRQGDMLSDAQRSATFKDGVAQGVELERIREEAEKTTLVTGLAQTAKLLLEEDAQTAKQILLEDAQAAKLLLLTEAHASASTPETKSGN